LDKLPHRNPKVLRHPVLAECRIRKVLHITDGVFTRARRHEIFAAKETHALDENLRIGILLTRDSAAPDVVALEQSPHRARTQRFLRVVCDRHAERGEAMQPHQT